jgi:trans-aconitate 2-methyltransferase
MTSPSWDPGVYLRFAAERARPFHDLMARVGVPPERPRLVVDLGCGPGGLTAGLAERYPQARVIGIDSSPEMIERAGRYASERVEFRLGDVTAWQPDEPVDVLVTNAVLQWVPGHRELLPRWAAGLAPGGWLAMQVPGNFAQAEHTLLDEVAAEVAPALRPGLTRAAVDTPLQYAAALAPVTAAVDAWETTYLHVLDPAGELGDDAVLAWVSGTALRPVLDALADDEAARELFVHQYTAALRKAYPRRPWGTPLPFRRVFAVAQAAGHVQLEAGRRG